MLATALAALPASDTGTFEFSILYRDGLPPWVRWLQPQAPTSAVESWTILDGLALPGWVRTSGQRMKM